LFPPPIDIYAGEAGILLFHGFTSSPTEFSELSSFLADQDISVYCPYIPGHGTTPEDLGKKRWTDWTSFAVETYRQLKEKHKCLFVGGLSFGGTLALYLASQFHVTGVVGMACGTRLQMPSLCLVPFVKRFIRHTRKRATNYMCESSNTRKTYCVNPLTAVHELIKYYKHLDTVLHKINSPLILLHSVYDPTVPYKNTQYILSHVSSAHTELITLRNSYHIITLDCEKAVVNKSVYSFIKKFL
jgi:carboxylesterase